jgi:hypothetical protein
VLAGVVDASGTLTGDTKTVKHASTGVLRLIVNIYPNWKKTHWRVLSVLASLARSIVCDCDVETIQEILLDCTRTNLKMLIIMDCNRNSMTSYLEVDSTPYIEAIERAVEKIEASIES